MTKILTELHTKALDDYKYVELTQPFIFISDVLKKNGYQHRVVIPTGMIVDYESVPLIKGTSKRSGLIHDFLSRFDSSPTVTKKIAADVYLEFMAHRKNGLLRRYVKYWVVRVAPGYFHKLSVSATYEDIINN